MLKPPRPAVAFLLIALVAIAVAIPFLGGPYTVKFATRVMVIAILVISLDFLIGITGLVSFGHAMFFGLGAYAIYFVSPEADAANALIAFPLAVLAAAVGAAIIGALAVLTRGFYFIMVTLAFGQMLFSLFHDTRFAGGSDGAYINVKPPDRARAGHSPRSRQSGEFLLFLSRLVGRRLSFALVARAHAVRARAAGNSFQ